MDLEVHPAVARLGLGDVGDSALGGEQQGRDGAEGLAKCLAAFCRAKWVTLAVSKPMPFFSFLARSATEDTTIPSIRQAPKGA